MFKINQYFDGQVASIAFQTATLPATVGVMAIGQYSFEPSEHETMTVVSGQLIVKLPGAQAWVSFAAGESFEVAAGSVFELKVEVETAYLCSYG